MLRDNLIATVDNFVYSPCKKYVLMNENLYHVSHGNLTETNVITGSSITYDLNHDIVEQQFHVLPSQVLYYKSKSKRLRMIDLKVKMSNNASAYTNLAVDVWKSQAALCDKLDYDPISNQLVTYLSTNLLYVLPELSSEFHDLPGTSDF